MSGECQHIDGECFLCSPMRHPSTAAGRRRIAARQARVALTRQTRSNGENGVSK
jgi:hypothetical protein